MCFQKSLAPFLLVEYSLMYVLRKEERKQTGTLAVCEKTGTQRLAWLVPTQPSAARPRR
jgi:hypothetical protein